MLCAINADPQLDLPPINAKKNALSANINGKPKVLPNSYTVKIIGSEEDDEKDDEHDGNDNDLEPNGRGDSTDFDRDRSLRYGPPYTDDTNRQFYRNNHNRNNNNNNNNYNNYYGDNYYNRSTNDDYVYRQRYNTYNNDGNNQRYYANRYRNNEDDRNYYAQRDRDRLNDPNNYYNYNSGGGIGGDGDGKYYADRNLPRDPPYYRNENDRYRYGNGYPYTNNQDGDGRPPPPPPYQNDNNFDRAPPGGRYPNPDGYLYGRDEQARFEQERIEQERRYRIEEANLRRILGDVDQQSSIECSLNVGAQWNFETNVNEATQQVAVSEAK